MQAVIDLLNTSGAVVKGVLDVALGSSGNTGNGGSGGTTTTTTTTTSAAKKASCPKPSGSFLWRVGGNGFSRNWIRLAGISGAAAVALGAYGAHKIESNELIADDRKRSFRSANLYHFIGTFGLIASSLSRFPVVSGTLFSVGTLVFCGSCYYFAITGEKVRAAPYGGSMLIAAWLSLIL